MNERRPPPLPLHGPATPGPEVASSPLRVSAASGGDGVPGGTAAERNAASSPLAEFQDEARGILAIERGRTPRAQALLAAAARRCGLSEDEADQALADLAATAADRGAGGPLVPLPRPPVPTPPPPSSVASANEACGEPPPPPIGTASHASPAPPLSPATTFLLYVREALARSSRDSLSERKEQRLIEEGVGKLHLSRALAKQIVHRVAADRGLAIASLARERRPETKPDAAAWAEFRSRAAAILARQGGINARSRMLLEAVADELGMPGEEMELAISSLQTENRAGKGEEDAYARERLAEFAHFLQAALPATEEGVVTPRAQRRWIEDARQRFGISAEEAERQIAREAAERNVRVITEAQAAEHLGDLARRLLRGGEAAPETVAARLELEADQWGVEPAQVRQILARELRRRDRWLSWQRPVVWTLAGTVPLAAMAIWGWIEFSRRLPQQPMSSRAAAGGALPAVASPAATPPSIDQPTGREWWARDPQLLAALTRLRAVVPEGRRWLQGLAIEDPESRARAHREMVRELASRTNQDLPRGLLRELLAGCLVHEPSDPCAAAILESLMGMVPSGGDRLPRDPDALDDAFWAIETAALAIGDEANPPARAEHAAGVVGRALGATVDPLRQASLPEDCSAALARQLFRMIVAQAAVAPDEARETFQWVRRRSSRLLAEHEIESAGVALLAAALPACGPAWRDYSPLILDAASSSDPLIVLRLLEVMEAAQDEDQRNFLAEHLLRRVGGDVRQARAADVARRIREALGVVAPATGADRWVRLQRLAAAAGQESPVSDPTGGLLQQTVNLARAATLAGALARGQAGFSAFDEVIGQGSWKVADENAASADVSNWAQEDPAQVRRRRQAAEFIQYLLNNRSRPAQRVNAFRNLAELSEEIADVAPESGRLLARYLLSSKAAEEHEAIAEFIAAVARWPNLRIALADELSETELQRERAERVVELALEAPLPPSEDSQWKQRAYRTLLHAALEQLRRARPDASRRSQVACDDLRGLLRDLYAIQARLAGVPAEKHAATDSPAQLLRWIIEAEAIRITAGELPEPARRWLESLPHLLEACELAAADELRKAVLLQRVRIRLAAIDVARQAPQKQAEIARTIEDLEARDRQAENVFAQLRDGEQALLHIWQKLAPEG